MGRELKRVPLDFNWEIGKIWEGFINPFYEDNPCRACGETGFAPLTRKLYEQWYGDAPFDPSETGSAPFTVNHPIIRRRAEQNVRNSRYLLFTETAILNEANRLLQLFNSMWLHHLDQDDVDALWEARRLWDFKEKPTAAQVNEWSITGLGHDSFNCCICVEAKATRLGYTINCPECNGRGNVWSSEEAYQRYEGWKQVEPPAGEGWQLWETVTEGSPVSPVFKTAEELVDWMVFEEGHTLQGAQSFIKNGWAPTFVIDPATGTFQNGIDAMGEPPYKQN